MKTADTLPLATVLSNAGAEIRRLADLAAEIDRACGSLPVGPLALPAETIRILQSADLMRQSLESLAGYLQALAAASGPEASIRAAPALQAIPLRDLAAALGGRVANPAISLPRGSEPDFF